MADELSPIEAIMWRVGQTGSLRMTVGAVLIVDRLPDRDTLLERLRFAGDHAERLTQRPGGPASLRSRPSWVRAPFSPEHQLRSLSVSAPGTMRGVLDLVGLLESVPFDPERSPWDVTLIDGLEDGKAAIFLRAHHVLTDGIGGIRLVGLLLDESAWPKDPLTPPAHSAAQPAPQPRAVPDPVEPRRPGSITFSATLDGPEIVGRALAGINSARSIDPVESAVHSVQWALDVANSVSRQLMVTGGPLTSRPTTRSMLSRFEVVSVEGARAAALALGGSRNDLLVAAAAAGIGLYHERLGEHFSELRLATPASTRGSDDAGGNWFAPTRLSVPTAIGRPGPQFGVVAERLDQARKEPALRVASALATSFRFLDTVALGGAPRPGGIGRLRRDRRSRSARATAHLRLADPGRLPVGPSARLSAEHLGAGQRGSPRHRDRTRFERDPSPCRLGRIADGSVQWLRNVGRRHGRRRRSSGD